MGWDIERYNGILKHLNPFPPRHHESRSICNDAAASQTPSIVRPTTIVRSVIRRDTDSHVGTHSIPSLPTPLPLLQHTTDAPGPG
jgi:hypothetical protein